MAGRAKAPSASFIRRPFARFLAAPQAAPVARYSMFTPARVLTVLPCASAVLSQCQYLAVVRHRCLPVAAARRAPGRRPPARQLLAWQSSDASMLLRASVFAVRAEACPGSRGADALGRRSCWRAAPPAPCLSRLRGLRTGRRSTPPHTPSALCAACTSQAPPSCTTRSAATQRSRSCTLRRSAWTRGRGSRT